MTIDSLSPLPRRDGTVEVISPSVSAISWGAVAGGAFAAAGVSLVLLAAGAGFGLAAASPWPGAAASVASFTVVTGLWLIVTQWVASGLGGYIAGRLRTRWAGLHEHEVFFRDTAHGLLTWSVTTVAVATVAIAAASAPMGTDRGQGASRETTGAQTYTIDRLFRSDHADDSPSAGAARSEAYRLLARDLTGGGVTVADRDYLAYIITARTGVTSEQALNRIDLAVTTARTTADTARKAAATASIFTAIALLIGALIACVAAALGGQQRDKHA